MIQRLIRGRLLYLLLGLLVVFLYWRSGSVGMLAHPEASRPAPSQPDPSMGWWPEALDMAALKQGLLREPRLGILLGLLSVLLVSMGLGGFVISIWSLWTGRVRSVWRFPLQRLPRWSGGELARVIMLTILIAGLLPFAHMALLSTSAGWQLDQHLWISGSMLVLDAFVVLTILTFAAGKGPSIGAAIGFPSRKLLRGIRAGLFGYLAVFPWLFILLWLVVEVARWLGFQPPLEMIQELVFEDNRTSVLVLTTLLACVIGPVAEELFFRGIVYTALRQRMPRLVAMLVSGALFSLIHTSLVGFLPIMVLGCLLAYLYERTGSLASPLAVHMLHNTLLMALAFTFRQLASLT